jgi:hypothetical protein
MSKIIPKNFFKNIIFYGLWFLLTILLAYWFSYPLDIFSRNNFWGGIDPTISLWVLNWQLTQLSLGNFDQLFTGNAFFYPLDRPIYLNAPTLSTALFTLPVFLVTKDPYICYAVAIFSSYILCSLGMFLLARSLKLDYAASFLAALIFAFSESRHGVSAYIHLVTIQWMPFTLVFIHKYFDEGRRIFLSWAAFFYLIQITASAYHGIFFSIILLMAIFILFFQQNNFKFKKLALDAAFPILIVGTIASAYFIPYLQEAYEFGFKRSIAEQSVYGAPIATFFSLPSSYYFASWTSHLSHIDGSTSPRYLPLLLTIVALFVVRKKIFPKSLFSSNFKNLLVWVICLTIFAWFLKPSITNLGRDFFEDLYLHPQLVTTVILSPLLLLVTAFFFMTSFFRTIYLGLCSEKVFFLYFFIAMLAFAVSLGPIIKLYDNQHIMINPISTFLYYIFPGVSSIRAISRMSILIPLGLGITAGLSYMLIRRWLDDSRFKKIFPYIVFTALILETYPAKGLHAPYKQQENQIPHVYNWLKKAQDGPVLEWPMSKLFEGDGVYLERSLIHKKKLINGYAAFEWDGRKKLAELTDLSNKRALLSLYAFGVRYLVVHRIGGNFPDWAGETVGEFKRVKKFDTALVYSNKNPKTNFLPENFLDYFTASVESVNGTNSLTLKFNSPDEYYISKNKKILEIKVKLESNANSFNYEWPFYPTLWQDGDSHRLILDKHLSRAFETLELTYSGLERNHSKKFLEIKVE